MSRPNYQQGVSQPALFNYIDHVVYRNNTQGCQNCPYRNTCPYGHVCPYQYENLNENFTECVKTCNILMNPVNCREKCQQVARDIMKVSGETPHNIRHRLRRPVVWYN